MKRNMLKIKYELKNNNIKEIKEKCCVNKLNYKKKKK